MDDPEQSDNRPFKSEKHYDFEGGIRVPLVAWWPGVIDGGRSFKNDAVISLDLMPTVLAAAGVSNPELGLDGKNLLPILEGDKNSIEDRSLFWSGGTDKIGKAYEIGSEAMAALRTEEGYKLVVQSDRLYLYDVATDLSESVDFLEAAYKNDGSVDFQGISDDDKNLLIKLFREYTEDFLQQMPKIGDPEKDFGKAKPVFKNAWSAALCFVDEFGSTTDIPEEFYKKDPSGNTVQQATTFKLKKDESQKLYVRSLFCRDGSTVQFEHWKNTPGIDIEWSLISTIGGSITQNGQVTAGDKDGYMIVVAQEKEERDISREEGTRGTPKAYQLVRVGTGGGVDPEPDTEAIEFRNVEDGNTVPAHKLITLTVNAVDTDGLDWVRIDVNGVNSEKNLTPASDGFFYFDVNLAEGESIIRIETKDKLGSRTNSDYISLTAELESEANPYFANIEDGETVEANSVVKIRAGVEGLSSEQIDWARLIVNGEVVAEDDSVNQSGFYSFEVKLPEGEHGLRLRVRDNDGQSSVSDKITIIAE
jgi:hypothetical protein